MKSKLTLNSDANFGFVVSGDSYTLRAEIKAASFSWRPSQKIWQTYHVAGVERLLNAAKAEGFAVTFTSEAKARFETGVAAYRGAQARCENCSGTGKYRGISKVTGKPIGGDCFRCQGRGTQTTADGERNGRYDYLAFAEAMR